MTQTLFISYSHVDDREHRWVQKLTTFLDGLKDELPVDVWADNRIGTGDKWREEIEKAISEAAAAVLLVGPGFLASDFVRQNELPELLKARGGWQGATGSARCRLNRLVVAIADDMRGGKIVAAKPHSNVKGLRAGLAAMMDHLEATHTAFLQQAERRNALVQAMRKRLIITEPLEYERFLFRYYERMDKEEQFEFDQLRAITEGVLHDDNRSMLEIISKNPALRDELPIVGALRLRLITWLNKYDRVFTKSEKMSVLYVGVEDGVRVPNGIDKAVTEWLRKNRT